MTTETLIWLIPLPPILSFFLIVLFTNRNKTLSHVVAVGAAFLSWLVSMMVFLRVLGIEKLGENVITSSINWLPAGDTWLRIGVLVDPLSAATLFFVAWTVLMIFIYSVGYHNYGQPKGDHDRPGLPPHGATVTDEHGHSHRVPSIEPMYSRFFAFISLFAFGMYTLVVSDNLLTLFIGWEIMGLCSYLLIGFWYGKPSARAAMIKAFITTRVGDVFMLLGLAYLYSATGTLNYRDIFYNAQVLERLATTASGFLGLSAAGLIGILLFIGTVGKSAQWPLHVWLPDAMEGPTPVSAMIHAATMVSAGVYMAIRIFPLITADWHGEALTPAMTLTGDDPDGIYRSIHGLVRSYDRCCSKRYQACAGLLHDFPVGLHDRSPGYWGVCGGSLSPGYACLFQGALIPRFRFGHSWGRAWRFAYRRAGRSPGYVQHGRSAQENAIHLLDIRDRWIRSFWFSIVHSRLLV